MTLPKTLLSLLLIVAFIFPNAAVVRANTANTPPTQTQPGAFTPAPCMFELPSGVSEGADIECGYLSVPTNHDHPEGQTIRLAVAIIRSLADQITADPLFIAQGGPGGSTLDTYIDPFLSANNRIRKDRDLVLFDQRGTLYSQPSLYCTEYEQFVIDHLESDLSSEEYNRLFQQVIIACRQRLASQGINLSDYNSIQNAHDIEALRLALGYDKINLYGVSYGTLLALHYMRLYPDSLRSVILDGIVAPQINTITDNIENQNRAFRHFFDSCTTNPDCKRSYPELEKVFYDLVAQLEETPAAITLTDLDNNVKYKAILDGEGTMGSVFQILYVSGLIPALPKMIFAATEGDFTVLSHILSIFVFDRSMSYGMYFSTWCTEDADFDPAQIKLEDINPVIAEFEKNSPQEFLETCNNWQVRPLDSEVDQPVISDIPTLLMSGAYDPVTPPYNAEIVAQTLNNSYNIVFPRGAHGQMLDNECSDSIILEFLDDPGNTPDTSCIARYAQPEFLTHKTVVSIPGILGLLNLEGNAGSEALLLVLALLFLGSVYFFLPISWFMNLLKPKPRSTPSLTGQPLPYALEYQEKPTVPPSSSIEPDAQDHTKPSLLIRLSGWLAGLNTTLLLSFCIAVVVILFQMISANDNRLFFGLDGAYRSLFIIPLIAALLTIAVAGAAIQGWAWKGWKIWRRLYFTLLTIAMLVCLGVLASWGMLTAYFY